MLRSIPGVIINYYLIINVLFLLHFNFNIFFFFWALDILPSPSTCNPLPSTLDQKANSVLSNHEQFYWFDLIKFNCLLFTFCTVSYRNFSPYFFVLTNFDSSWRHTHATTHVSGKQEICAETTHLIRFLFCRGNKYSSRCLAGFYRKKTQNLPLALRTCEKNWTRLVGVYISENISRLNKGKQFRTGHSPPKSTAFSSYFSS